MFAEFKSKILRLLREDEEFRYAVAGLLGLSEILKRLDALTEEQVRLREEQVKIWKEIASLREEQMRLREEQVRLREEQVKIWKEIASLREEQMRLREEQVRLREEQVKIWKEIASLREEQVRFREEQVRLREEVKSLREEQVKIWKEIERLRNDMVKGFKRHDEILEKHSAEIVELRKDMVKGFDLLRRHIDALGARWGLMAEESFRKGLRGLVERFLGGRVERWSHYDEDGQVFGHPSVVDIDLVVRDREHILIEVKSSVSRGDVYELWRIGKLYEKVEGVKPRLAVVSPYIDDAARKAAERLGVETYAP